jgi:hypothetical protein
MIKFHFFYQKLIKVSKLLIFIINYHHFFRMINLIPSKISKNYVNISKNIYKFYFIRLRK